MSWSYVDLISFHKDEFLVSLSESSKHDALQMSNMKKNAALLRGDCVVYRIPF